MPVKTQKPKLIVIAGPNGSGKTTFTNQVLRHDWSQGCIFINPDEIAKNVFGDWNSPDAVMKAVVRAQEVREECLRDRKSMLLESVFSVPDKLDFIKRAKEADFFVRFFFIGTDGPHINAARVVRRVMDGGHDVPIAKIISRYNRSIANSAVAMAKQDFRSARGSGGDIQQEANLIRPWYSKWMSGRVIAITRTKKREEKGRVKAN